VLRELRIENLLLIERVELEFDRGLTVLTGETGAGKTVLAHSLDLLTGGKARKGIVRPGAPEAWVEGVFDLPDGWEEDPALAEIRERLPAGSAELVLGRRVSANGRTSAFIGGRAASAADLALLSERLIAFFGQHEHRRLTIASAQLGILDSAGGMALEAISSEYRDAWTRLQAARAEIARYEAEGGGRDPELLRHELAEIEAVAPAGEEKTRLEEEQARLQHVDALRRVAAEASAALKGDGSREGATSDLARAASEVVGQKGVDPQLDRIGERLESLSLEAEDLAGEIASYLASVEVDPARLAEVEARLDSISILELKFGGSIASVLEHAERCRVELESHDAGAGRLESLRSEEAEARREVDRLAAQLSSARTEAAKVLSERVSTELSDLAMEGATLGVEIIPSPEPGPTGAERTEFMLSPNRGIEPRPLREAASGGELSRVMLALVGPGSGDSMPTLVFDEIDAGIGGTTASIVGERLREAAEGRQVIAITHLPQVASRAERHFSVVKQADGDPATASVTRLEGDQVVSEIARMMGAEAGDEAATRHARELVAAGRSD
jgi:DNA repair protein RecN (Recombination protein N)